MAIETVTSEAGEIVPMSVFKRELDIWDGTDDELADFWFQAARDYIERISERTLRLSATRTYATECWPSDGWVLRHPPVTAVTSIVYRDTNNAEQTLGTGNYQVNITAEGFARVTFTATAELPSLYDRLDAVKVTYTCGYASADVAPGAAKAAIVLAGKAAKGMGDVRQQETDEKRAMSLAYSVAAPTYA